MKKSCDWNRQPNVDKAADAILAEGKATLDTITAYQVAERLCGSANPSLYAKFRDWRARRQAQAEPLTVDVPPEVEAIIRAIFKRLTDDGVDACLGAVRAVGASLDRAAILRISDADRRAERAEAETADVVAIGERIEQELTAATVRIAKLEQALADAQRREDRLMGRLEQQEADRGPVQQDPGNDEKPWVDTGGGDDVGDIVNAANLAKPTDAGVACDGNVQTAFHCEGDDAIDESDKERRSGGHVVPIPATQLRLTYVRSGIDDNGGYDAQ